MTFRPFAVPDLSACLELYKLNEPDRFPEGVISQYEKSLTDPTGCFLIAESDGEIVASGGLSMMPDGFVVLCFGLVRPSHQGKGIGAALLLARLALLPPTGCDYHILIFAVEKSIGYYRRFGFSPFITWHDPQGASQPSGHLELSSSEILKCRALLNDHGIVVPTDLQIPLPQPKN